ncbi:single-stranded DNA-binding protein [Aeoliella mucimassa]|uniref:Single-stranded DNA-binding protein n=1 Tax=Aeoliella mucimassa TaxID=2527972 RepID=A0A518AST9_9BACT|nr:single-stranded DNA-binding protein [Aeoliella mucimassa]QDU57766.1 Single-stranded DNA-binding protein [Aeoliella mucimassa]
MASFNRVILVGNLTRDPELRYIPSGTAVAEIGMAVNERVKRNDQWVDEVNFFDVTLWGRTAEVVNQYLSKGSSVLIEGRLKYDTWEKDGQKRSKVKIIGEKMQMLSGGGAGGGGGGGGGGRSSGNAPHRQQPASHDSYDDYSSAPSMPPDDEIPF